LPSGAEDSSRHSDHEDAQVSDDSREPLQVRRATRHRWRALIVRAVIASLIAWVLATVPFPRIMPIVWFAYIQVPLVIFLLICYFGKLLVDTLFYDHYPM
jgi:hypothetical protein